MIVTSILLYIIHSAYFTKVQAKAPPTDPKPLSWNITLIESPTTEHDSMGNPVMVLQYLMSNRYYDVKVLKNDCESISSVPTLAYNDYFSTNMGFLDVMVNLTINQADIEASDIWNNTSSLDGSFSFCVSTSLYLNETKTEDTVVSRSYHIFNVEVDKRSGLFELAGIDIYVPGPDTNDDFVVDFEGNVTAYQCDPDTLERVTVPPPLGPFDVLNVCVEETSNKNITIDKIIDLRLEQNETFTTFVAVIDGAVKPGYEDIVLKWCAFGKCIARIQLINAFFTSEQAYSIDVTGTVLLAFGNNSRRLGSKAVEIPFVLGNGDEGKDRQLEGKNADFETKIDLREPCEDSGAGGILGKLLSSFIG